MSEDRGATTEPLAPEINPWDVQRPDFRSIPSPVSPLPGVTTPEPRGALTPTAPGQPSPMENVRQNIIAPFITEAARGAASDIAMFAPQTGQSLSNLLGPPRDITGSEAVRGLGAATPFALLSGRRAPFLMAAGAAAPYVGDYVYNMTGSETARQLAEAATGVVAGGYSDLGPTLRSIGAGGLGLGAALLHPLSWEAYAARDLVQHLASPTAAKVAGLGAATLAALGPGIRFAGQTLRAPIQNIRNFLAPAAGLFGGEAGPAPPVQAAPANAAGGPAPASAPQTEQEQQASRNFFDRLLFDIPHAPHNLLQGPP